jgi:hypothetical protein
MRLPLHAVNKKLGERKEQENDNKRIEYRGYRNVNAMPKRNNQKDATKKHRKNHLLTPPLTFFISLFSPSLETPILIIITQIPTPRYSSMPPQSPRRRSSSLTASRSKHIVKSRFSQIQRTARDQPRSNPEHSSNEICRRTQE